MESYDMLFRFGLRTALSLLLCVSALAGCQQGGSGSPAAPTVQEAAAKAQKISWFEGSVEEAFALARDSDKPLFVYWGARWCPPCNQLKSTVFKQADFIAQTRRYIAVYIDGDAPDAQRWAEHFGAMGYPTLIVFDAAGSELTRLSSGMELERYARVLDTAHDGRGIKVLVEQGFGDPAGLTTEEWERLVWYPWGVDEERVLTAEKRLALFERLRAVDAPSALLARRLELVWWLEREYQGKLDFLDEGEQRDGQSLLLEVLGAPAEWRASLTEIEYGALPLIEAFTEAGSVERDLLLKALSAAMESAWNDSGLGLKERVLTARVLIHQHRLEQGDTPLPEALKLQIRERLETVLKLAKTPYERQSLVFYAAWYRHEIGDDEQALEILEAELKTAIAPYYYMSYLAEIEKARGNADAALQWSGRAFAAAKGAATRLQWGMAHLHELIDLRPADETAVQGVLGEMLRLAKQSPGSLYQRTRVRLERLDAPLRNWAAGNAQRSAWLQSWRSDWRGACDALDPEAQATTTCKQFLHEL